MSEFADGLQLSRLHPPSIIVFLQGLPRRVDQRLLASTTTPGATSHGSAVQAICDRLAEAAQALKDSGYAPDHDLEDHSPPKINEDPELKRVNAAALEVARRVAGVPDSGWTQQPDLLDFVRQCCADIAEHLNSISEAPDPFADDDEGDADGHPSGD